MTVSDLLVILTIVAALIAVISERNRTYVWLKFSVLHRVILISSFFLIHYLLAFDWFLERFPFLHSFDNNDCPTPAVWAYLVSISILIWAFYKIFEGFYPKENLNAVVNNYNQLLMKGDFVFLGELIEKYHHRDILLFLEKRKSELDISKDENATRLLYAANIYSRIVTNDAFLEAIVPINPRFYAPIIRSMNSKKVKSPELVNRYLKILTRTKNSFFFREIQVTLNLHEDNTYRIQTDKPILYALFHDIKVAEFNEAWRGIADEALLEIRKEALEPNSPLRYSDIEKESDTLWSYRMQNAIYYFDIMVRQAIKAGVGNHMWMYYYEHFVDAIIENMVKLPEPDSDINKKSRNFDMINTIFTNMLDWKDVVLKTKQSKLVCCIYDVIGRCMFAISTTGKLTDEDKRGIMNTVWEDLIDRTFALDHNDHKEQAIVDEITREGFKIFKKPSGLFTPPYDRHNADAYLIALKFLWKKRDQPKLHGYAGQRADRFEHEVINSFH
jgi:hypothetical protein